MGIWHETFIVPAGSYESASFLSRNTDTSFSLNHLVSHSLLF
ncbi:hypothetical protein [Streptomyces sp. NPDC004230]